MPIYEFDCLACGRPFEDRVSYSEIKDVRCPHCGSNALKRKVSLFASQRKSSGGGAGASCETGGT